MNNLSYMIVRRYYDKLSIISEINSELTLESNNIRNGKSMGLIPRWEIKVENSMHKVQNQFWLFGRILWNRAWRENSGQSPRKGARWKWHGSLGEVKVRRRAVSRLNVVVHRKNAVVYRRGEGARQRRHKIKLPDRARVYVPAALGDTIISCITLLSRSVKKARKCRVGLPCTCRLSLSLSFSFSLSPLFSSPGIATRRDNCWPFSRVLFCVRAITGKGRDASNAWRIPRDARVIDWNICAENIEI